MIGEHIITKVRRSASVASPTQCQTDAWRCTQMQSGPKVLAFDNVGWLVGVEFNAPLDTVWVISEAVFAANHLTDTDKQNSTGKYR